jgi:dephospho-CoA kinase
MNLNNKIVIGIIGGSGTGKTHISKYIAEDLEATFIEADLIGHQLLNDPDIKQQIVAIFGKRVLDEDKINRQLLGDLVFNDNVALMSLNEIMHSSMYELINEKINNSPTPIVILEAAVMIEAGFYKLVDIMICLEANNEVQLNRLVKLRGFSHESAVLRLKNQRNDFAVYADYVLDTSNGLSSIEEKLSQIMNRIKEKSNEKHI